jgi:hypothetical protein
MSKIRNPLNLNPLQLRTLTLLQELARHPGHAAPAADPKEVIVSHLPQPHGDHLHVGAYLVRAQDASGLANESAWKALERKGLAKSMYPFAIVLTEAGLAYDTGLRQAILHGADH